MNNFLSQRSNDKGGPGFVFGPMTFAGIVSVQGGHLTLRYRDRDPGPKPTYLFQVPGLIGPLRIQSYGNPRLGMVRKIESRPHYSNYYGRDVV